MAKKDEAAGVTNRDILQRMSFMYQASAYLNALPEPTAKPTRTTTQQLAKSYINSMKAVGRKTVVKMDPAVKRTLCKGCNAVLIPGGTARVRVKGSSTHSHVMTYTCRTCSTKLRIPAPSSSRREPPMFKRPGHINLSGSQTLEGGVDEGVFIV